jgi:hypothetical protein
MSNLDPTSPAGYAMYKLLSVAGGKDLRQVELERLRERRKNFLEGQGVRADPPFYQKRIIETLIEMGLEESECIPNFDPDLLILSRKQYRAFLDLSAAVPLNLDTASKHIPNAEISRLKAVQPPMPVEIGEYTIEMTYSDSTERMLLVDSGALSETVEL